MYVDGIKIKMLREAMELSTTQLAKSAGFLKKNGTGNPDSIRKIEVRKSYKLNIHVANAVARRLKVSIDTIRGEG